MHGSFWGGHGETYWAASMKPSPTNLTIKVLHSANTMKNAPTSFFTAVADATAELEASWNPPQATILRIQVDYNEVQGSSLGGALGASTTTFVPISYASFRTTAQAINLPGSASLPAASPFSGTMEGGLAQSKALGFTADDGHTIDGYCGIASTALISYPLNITPTGGKYYGRSTILHEMTECMGRVALLDLQPNFYAPMDLFRYKSDHTRCLVTDTTNNAWFSIDGGTTLLRSWNNNPSNGDTGDWNGNGTSDCCDDFGTPNTLADGHISSTDITLMSSMGFN